MVPDKPRYSNEAAAQQWGGLRQKLLGDNRDTEHEGLGFEDRLIQNND